MDGIHDLGGKQGFGAIDVHETEEAFHQPLDGFGWAMNQTMRAPGLCIDWWRHIRELTPPVDYLTRPYFDQWVMTQVIAMIDTGQLTLEEVLANKAMPLPQTAKSMTVDDVCTATKNAIVLFNREIEQAPHYQLGDRVTMRDYSVSGHTRLPNYVLGKTGVIDKHHGAHLYPDRCVKGDEQAAHLYTVKFNSHDLWPDGKEQGNVIYLDLWEPYFVN